MARESLATRPSRNRRLVDGYDTPGVRSEVTAALDSSSPASARTCSAPLTFSQLFAAGIGEVVVDAWLEARDTSKCLAPTVRVGYAAPMHRRSAPARRLSRRAVTP